MTTSPSLILWKRFWSPLGTPISCDDDGKGFLLDPEKKNWMSINDQVVELGSLLDRPCLILLGEPGMGKSTTLKAARKEIEAGHAQGNSSLWIEFRDVPDTETFIRRTIETPTWKNWTGGQHKLSLVIDGLDEGLLKIPGFLSFLRAELETIDLSRFQLILVCRFADWPVLEGNELQALWPKFEKEPKFELCPLRREDVLLAARERHLEENTFIQAVREAHVTGLANRPVTLFMLLGEFSTTGKLPGTHRDLYQAGCRTLCREVDQRKIESFRRTYPAQHRPSEAQKFQTACRLASLLMLSGKAAFFTGDPADATDTDLALSQILGGSELVDGVRISVNELLVWETLTTALFSSRGENRLGFAHQTFMESLAAEYLKNLPLIQVNQLLCQSDGYELHVVPQLTEMAAWLAGEHSAFCEQLIAKEPEVMLRTDVALLAIDQKKRLVDRLLERAQNEEAFDGFGSDRFYAGLNHRELEKQLLAVLGDKSKNYIARRMAMSIAGACRVVALTSPLLNLISDPSEDAGLKRFAAEALKETTPVERLIELIPLVEGTLCPDPDDDIRANALRALIPKYFSIGEASQYFTAPKPGSHIGSYRILLSYQLPSRIQPGDVIPLLSIIARRSKRFRQDHWLRELADHSFCAALLRLDEPEIADALTLAWVTQTRSHGDLPLDKNFQFHALLHADTERRRNLISLLLNSSHTTNDDMHGLIPPQIVSASEDLPWLLEKLKKSEEAHWIKWLTVIHHHAFDDIIAIHWDLFWDGMRQVPLLHEFYQDRFRAWDLNEPIARKAKANWLRQKRLLDRHASPPEPLLEDQIRDALSSGLSDNVLAWVNLCELLFCKEEVPHYWGAAFEIVESPGWLQASDSRKTQIKELARHFLLEARDERIDGKITFDTWAGYMAILLLGEDVLNDAPLSAAVKEKWMEAVMDGPVENDSFDKCLTVMKRLEASFLETSLHRAFRKNKADHVSYHGFDSSNRTGITAYRD